MVSLRPVLASGKPDEFVPQINIIKVVSRRFHRNTLNSLHLSGKTLISPFYPRISFSFFITHPFEKHACNFSP
ncbi:MAG: hypothetical protein A4E62_03154 [Syntrophorhabdus sp. PtaU1.Bin002]|nr:MAG: hypothetical protein A4E62_03154 [Syntrophorhabdus sp. PtaU1.Bin002]